MVVGIELFGIFGVMVFINNVMGSMNSSVIMVKISVVWSVKECGDKCLIDVFMVIIFLFLLSYFSIVEFNKKDYVILYFL